MRRLCGYGSSNFNTISYVLCRNNDTVVVVYDTMNVPCKLHAYTLMHSPLHLLRLVYRSQDILGWLMLLFSLILSLFSFSLEYLRSAMSKIAEELVTYGITIKWSEKKILLLFLTYF